MKQSLEDLLTGIPWSTLEGCYENGGNLPPLFRVIASKKSSASQRKKAWADIWAALYHQDSTYPASYASVPVLALLARDAPSRRDRREAALLAGSIEVWTRPVQVRALPALARRAHADARKLLKKIARPLLLDGVREADLQYMGTAWLAIQGKKSAAYKMLYSDLEENESEDEDEDQDDRELVMKVPRFKREKGLIYALDLDGDIVVRRNVRGGVKSEKVLKLGVKRAKGYAYQLDGSRIVRTRHR